MGERDGVRVVEDAPGLELDEHERRAQLPHLVRRVELLAQLVEHGMVVLKFWLHISAEEQLKRFKEREQVEVKQYKITDEDWRNRARREDYERAVSDMVVKTSTEIAPWTLVPGNDKRYARIEVMKTFIPLKLPQNATLMEWYKNDGDAVTTDEVIGRFVST